MKGYIFRKALLAIPLLLGITLITFSLTKALPGDPVFGMVGERASPEAIAKIRSEIGADKGLVPQYVGYVSLLLRGEFGRSYYTNRRVVDDLEEKFPRTIELAFATMLIAAPIGVCLGLLAALRRGRLTDRLISWTSILGLSVPVFWSGLLLMLFFSLYLRLLPPSGTGGLRYLVLPAVTLSLPSLSTLARVTRIWVIDVMDMPFIRTARAKGVTEVHIRAVHIMKNVLIPLVTVIGLDFGSYLSGAVLTETIFAWDGIGRFAVEGILKRDYPVIMGCIILSTVIFVGINTVIDIVYHYADPRVRIHGARG